MEKRKLLARRKTDKAIQESEENYRLLIVSSPYGWAYHKIIVDENNKPVDYIFLEINDAFEDLTGLKREDIVNKKVTEALPGIEKDPVDWIGKYGEVAQTGKEIRFENYSEAVKKWFSVTAFCPKKGYFVVVFDDVTKRKKVEDALIESESRYREMFNSLGSGVAVYTPLEDGSDFIINDMNPTAERLSVVNKRDIIGKKVTEAFPGVKEFGLFEKFQQVWKTGEPQHHPVSLYKDNKLSKWYKNYVYKLPAGDIVAIYEDITPQKAAEEGLESVSRFPSEDPNPIVRIDSKYKIIYTNDAFDKLLKESGLSTEDSFKILPDKMESFVDHVLNTDQPVHFEEVTVGDKIISYNIIPVAEQGYVNLYGRDVTVRWKALNELKARTEELERINRAFVGRELRMMELKEEIEELKKNK